MTDSTQPAAETTPLETDLSGRQVGGYRLLRRLGQGAMAEVYLAEQVSLGRQVAFKVLRSNLATDATYVERFQQEARAAAQLIHANIVQIYEVGVAEGIHFIAQEYVQGVNLAELMARRGPPELARMLAIVRQVAAALAKAAEHGIVHRDIKPENIMLAAGGEVKVADFGLARLTTSDAANNLTQVGITMGTPLYMSPEQIEGKPLDARSDIYSLGVTSYQMLAGEPPFRGETALAVAVQHLNVEPRRLENVRTDLPPSVCRIVHTMLAKNPAERYVTPRQLLADVRAVSIELFQDDPVREADTWQDDLLNVVEARRQATERLAAAMQTSAMPALRRRRAWSWLVLTFACLVVGFGASWLLRPRLLITAAPIDPQSVPRQETAESQYVYAIMLSDSQNAEAALKSVPYYFGERNIYARRAMQQLGLLYLRDREYARAMEIFDQFAAFNDAEVQFKAFGLAGQAVVLYRQGELAAAADRQALLAAAADKLAQLYPRRRELEGEMRLLVELILRDQKLPGNRQTLEEWREWFSSSPPGPTNAANPSVDN